MTRMDDRGNNTTPPNPLSTLTQEQLWNIQWYAKVLCNRAPVPMKKKHLKNLCILSQVLDVESNLRGDTIPHAPFHEGDLLAI